MRQLVYGLFQVTVLGEGFIAFHQLIAHLFLYLAYCSFAIILLGSSGFRFLEMEHYSVAIFNNFK
jgi:hypothetical protein